MKAPLWAALAALTFALPGTASAFDFTPRTVSVYGAVGAGSGEVQINQNSTANFAGVIQAGPNVSTSIQQSGQYNSAVIGQVGGATSATALQTGAGWNHAQVGQTGNNNSAIVGQIGYANGAMVGQFGPNSVAGIGQVGPQNRATLFHRWPCPRHGRAGAPASFQSHRS